MAKNLTLKNYYPLEKLNLCQSPPGFDRTVPGYPRYQYSGDQDSGEHNLVITGATLQDDGEYQCQVGPGKGATPIWSAATVTVLGEEEMDHSTG